jgi:hypothetical protein
MGCIHARAAFATRDPQQAAVMHAVEQLRAGVRRAAEPVGDLAVREVRVDVARMHRAARRDEVAHRVRLLPARRRPRHARRARMHQVMVRARQEAVIDEEVLFQRQFRVAAFEVAGAITHDAVAQRQVLRTRGRADRVRLHETEPRDRPRERGRLEQRAGDGVVAQVVEGDRHALKSKGSTAERRTHQRSICQAHSGAMHNLLLFRASMLHGRCASIASCAGFISRHHDFTCPDLKPRQRDRLRTHAVQSGHRDWRRFNTRLLNNRRSQ